MRNYHGRIKDVVGHRAHRDTVQLALVSARPDLGSQQAQGHGDQAMVEVRQHDIIASPHQIVIKHDGSLLPGMRMFQPVGTPDPTAAQFGHIENQLGGQSREEQNVQPEPTAPTVEAAIPLPRARPVLANLQSMRNDPAPVSSDNRTMFEKLADLVPMRFSLASLTPGDGLLGERKDLTALGYDGQTAVYDISAQAVYLPNGSKLEAHSGLGGLMDNPAHVDQRMVGATPPNVYDLKPREKLFHGVPALRMTPVGENEMHGRTGLLVHSYMLGPNGDSNGCVSIRDYDRFLTAYQNGDVRRLVVVPSLREGLTASRRSPSPS